MTGVVVVKETDAPMLVVVQSNGDAVLFSSDAYHTAIKRLAELALAEMTKQKTPTAAGN